MIGFNVKPEPQTAIYADQEGVEVRSTQLSTMQLKKSKCLSRACSSLSTKRRSSVMPKFARSSSHQRLETSQDLLLRMESSVVTQRHAFCADGAVLVDNLTIDSLKRFKDDATEVREGLSAVWSWKHEGDRAWRHPFSVSRCARKAGISNGPITPHIKGCRSHQSGCRNLLETKIKDPRLGFVTVTDARVTGDLQQASIFTLFLAISMSALQLQRLSRVPRVRSDLHLS